MTRMMNLIVLSVLLCQAVTGGCSSNGPSEQTPPIFKSIEATETAGPAPVDFLLTEDGADAVLSWTEDHRGDFNGDGLADGRDLFPLAARFNQSSGWNGTDEETAGNLCIDGNRDGALDGLDLFIVSTNFLRRIDGFMAYSASTVFGPFETEAMAGPDVYEGCFAEHSTRITGPAQGTWFDVASVTDEGGSTFTATPRRFGESDAIHVGTGLEYETIEEAYEAVAPGGLIIVHRLDSGEPYYQTAVQVYKAGITIRALQDVSGRVVIDGTGYDYNGVGPVPRAIFQINPGGDGFTLEGFELKEAHNDSDNGAGVRINQSNDVTVRDCEIHSCDMGMMSGGDGASGTGARQLIESCHVHDNGSFDRPGYNHNFYMAGTSVTIRYCNVHSPLTGQNVKSRAHYTRVEYSFIHDSLNREFDLVDGEGETDLPGSHAVLIGNLIVKDPDCTGNKATIHFGQDGGNDHTGDLYLVHNTIVSPFLTTRIDLSAPGAGAVLANNIFYAPAGHGNGLILASARSGADIANLSGFNNWLSLSVDAPVGSNLDGPTTFFGADGQVLGFADLTTGDGHLAPPILNIHDAGRAHSLIEIPGIDGNLQPLSEITMYEFAWPLSGTVRPDDGSPDLGSFEEPE